MTDLNALFSHLPPSVFAQFEYMGWAEEVIAQRMAACPARAPEIRACFMLCVPVVDMPGWLYQAHCEEMLTRYLDGWSKRDIELATGPEVLMWMSKASLAAPPGTAWSALQMALFQQYAPAEMVDGVFGKAPDAVVREPFEGSNEQLLLQLRKRGKVARHMPNRAAYGLDAPIERPAAHSGPLVQQAIWG